MVMIWSDLNGNIKHVGLTYGQGLANLVEQLDEFKCHANNMNHLRYQYKEILADLADSDIASDILSQIYGTKGTFTKLSNNLGNIIRQSNYALC